LAIQTALNFSVQLQGDGTSTSIAIDLTSDAIFYADTPGSSNFVASGFNPAKIVATAVQNLSTAYSPSASLDSRGKIMTLSFSPAPAGGAGNQFSVTGLLLLL